MLIQHDRAFKEWAVACEAMKEGRQVALVRKGGIREEDGVFRIDDPEFFLMPTFEHQNPRLVHSEFVPDTEASLSAHTDHRSATIDAYAVVDTILTCGDEDRVNMLTEELIWNEEYVRLRFDFNPYDPLYVLILRVHCLPEATTMPMRSEYGGCKSWVTLERPLSTVGAVPALSDSEFAARRARVMEALGTGG